MSLTVCRECAKEVSTHAFSCPHCGAPCPAKKVWRGWGVDWKTKATLGGIPLIHVAAGFDEHRKLRVAKGIIAIGQFGIGLITIAQFGIGILFGLGQFMLGLAVVAQFAVAYVAVGQIILAYYGLAQVGFAKYIWSTMRQDPEAIELFRHLAQYITGLWK